MPGKNHTTQGAHLKRSPSPRIDLAVNQLQRYMQFYDCKTGYAVAKELGADLLPGMTFIRRD